MEANGPKKEGSDTPGHAPVDFNPISLAFELGYTIAIPLVIFALAGRYADKYFDSSPLWLIVGLIVSIAITSFLLVRKMKSYF